MTERPLLVETGRSRLSVAVGATLIWKYFVETTREELDLLKDLSKLRVLPSDRCCAALTGD